MIPETSIANSNEFIEAELSPEEEHILQLLEGIDSDVIWVNHTQKGIVPGSLNTLKMYYSDLDVFHILESLVRKGMLDRIDNGILLLCPSCGSHESSTHKSCPSCGSNKLRKKNKIVHTPCDHWGTFDEFKGGTTITCPICKENIESDKILENKEGFSYSDPYFECQKCRSSANRTQTIFLCNSCKTQYKESDAVELEQTGFKVAVEPVKTQKQSISNPSSENVPELEENAEPEIKEPEEKAKPKKKKTSKKNKSAKTLNKLEKPEKQREQDEKINREKNQISDENPQTEFETNILGLEMMPENVPELEENAEPENKENNAELIKKIEMVPETRSKRLPLKKSLVNNMTKILIVEDDVFSNESLKFLLESILDQKCEVRSLYDGDKVTEEILNNHYDLVFLDNKLPNKNGLEILKELKSNKNKTDIIFLTGYSDEETAVQAMKLGAKDYLSKGSFSVDKLTEAIYEIIKDDRSGSDIEKEELIDPITEVEKEQVMENAVNDFE